MDSLENLASLVRLKLGMIAEIGTFGEEVSIIGAIRKSSWKDGIDLYEGKFIVQLDDDGYVMHLPLGQRFVERIAHSNEEVLSVIENHYRENYSDFL